MTYVSPQASLSDTTQPKIMPHISEEEEEDDDDDDDNNVYSDFDNNGFSNNWGGEGFGDNGFDDMESTTIVTIITDVYRLFKCRTRRTSQSAGSRLARSTNHIWSEDRLIRLIIRQQEFTGQ